MILEYLISIKANIQVVLAEPPNKNRWWRKHNSNQGVCETALNHAIPVVFKGEYLQHYPADLLVSVKTDHIFSQTELDFYPLGGVNLHSAPLPEYRGCNCLSHAILNGDALYGVTLHWMDRKIDAGPIITRTLFPMESDETAWSLNKKVQKCAVDLFTRYFPIFSKGREKIPGHYPNMELSTYYHRSLIQQHKCIDRSMSDSDLYRTVRAVEFEGFEPAYFVLDNGKKIYLRTTY